MHILNQLRTLTRIHCVFKDNFSKKVIRFVEIIPIVVIYLILKRRLLLQFVSQ